MKIEEKDGYFLIKSVDDKLSVSFDTREDAELYLKLVKARCKVEWLSNGKPVYFPPEKLSDLSEGLH